MPFSFTVSLNDASHLPQDAALLAAVQAAAADWSQALNGLGSLDILVKVEATATERASGGSETSVFWGTAGSRSVFQPSALAELITGTDPNGATPDAIITVDPTYLLKELWFDPDPAHPQPVPGNRTDAASVLRHELGHALGVIGWRDLDTPEGYPRPTHRPGTPSSRSVLTAARGSRARMRGQSTAATYLLPRWPMAKPTSTSGMATTG